MPNLAHRIILGNSTIGDRSRSPPSPFDTDPMIGFRATLFVVLGFAATSWLRADPSQSLDGQSVSWDSVEIHDLQRDVEPHAVSLTTTGPDPFLFCDLPPVSTAAAASRDHYLSLEYLCPEGVRAVELFVGRPARAANRYGLPAIDRSEGWTTYKVNLSDVAPAALNPDKSTPIRIDFGRKPGVRIQVRNVRLRPATDLEIEQKKNAAAIVAGKETLAAKIDDYYAKIWPATIADVKQASQTFTIRGTIDGSLIGQPLGVVARELHETAALPISSETKIHPIDSSQAAFTVRIPLAGNPDLQWPGMRFQIVRDDQAVSAARYVDDLDAARQRTLKPPARLHAAKGVTCLNEFRSNEIKELGLQHGSVNILLNRLIRLTPHRGYQPMHLSGHDVFFHAGAAADLDRRVRMGNDAGLQLAGILLIANRDGDNDPLVHPTADPAGTYSMPNLTTPEAARLYALTLMFLADRYATPDNRHGRIDQWIVHNEVDAGWSWTNMGEQPMPIFLDHYFRSMRMVDAAVRQVNPHARAYISLTHHWNPKTMPKWRWYGSKPIVESLVTSGQVEGDFPWAMGYHPYPQSLWEADTWNDDPAQVTDDFDTPKITMKNLQVLDRYLHTDALRTRDGAVRPMICSEQGFHADEDNPEQLRNQVTALLYTFDILRRCPSVLAFDYHRPIDNRNEGGLRLGLRGLVSKENPRGVAKPAWDVYKAIGTDAEAALQDQYRTIWSAD